MLPPIRYKIHPKMAEILEQKARRRQLLEQARIKQQSQLHELKQDRKQYMQNNKQQITRKLTQIHQCKVIKRNRIHQEDKERPMRIAIKKSQRLMQLIPQRRALIEQLRQEYLHDARDSDQRRQAYVDSLIQTRISQTQVEFNLQAKVRENNIIDTNDGICVICLTSEAHVFMQECRHLVSCGDCQFILRMHKKCPLCRQVSAHSDLKDIKKRRKSVKM